jgi:hypothetical protein
MLSEYLACVQLSAAHECKKRVCRLIDIKIQV